jgi:hypothetical protein
MGRPLHCKNFNNYNMIKTLKFIINIIMDIGKLLPVGLGRHLDMGPRISTVGRILDMGPLGVVNTKKR